MVCSRVAWPSRSDKAWTDDTLVLVWSATKGIGGACLLHVLQEHKIDIGQREVAVDRDRLLVRGVLSGEMLTIINPEPETPLTQEDYPPGKLIALTDPSTAPLD